MLVRERVIYAELKTMVGRSTPAQLDWQARLRAAGQEVYEWRPNQGAEVRAILANLANA